MDRLYFVVNPIAGSGQAAEKFAKVRQLLDEKGVSYGFALTEGREHAKTLTTEALEAGERVIVAVGGDGTANEVASVMADSGAVMGIMPFGTGNDLARLLKLPTDPEGAVELMLSGDVRNMDAGMANERFFLNVSGIGFDVDVLINTEAYKKKLNGMLPYLLGIMKSLTHLRTLHMTITSDGGEVRNINGMIVSVGNGQYIGGGMRAVPDADPFDGVFDVCVARELKAMGFLRLLPKFIKGKHRGLPAIEYFQTRELYIECPEECIINLDGELYPKAPVHYRILPGAVRLICKNEDRR